MLEWVLIDTHICVSQIEILLGKTENFDELMAASAEEREIVDGEVQG